MKKADYIKYLGQQGELKKSLKTLQRTVGRNADEANSRDLDEILRLEGILGDLEGVSLHEGYPVRVVRDAEEGLLGVFAAPENASRFVDIQRDAGSGEFRAIALRSEGGREIDLGTFATERKALAAAKQWIATLRTGRPIGRPKGSRNQVLAAAA